MCVCFCIYICIYILYLELWFWFEWGFRFFKKIDSQIKCHYENWFTKLIAMSFTFCESFSFFFFNSKLFIYLWLQWVFTAVNGLSLGAVNVGSLSLLHTGFSLWQTPVSWSIGCRCSGSVVVVLKFRCSMACGILPDQGLKLCPLNWQADGYPLHHQGSSRD